MRKIAATILLLSLIAPVFLPGFLANLKKVGIRKEVSALIDRGIEEDDLTLLTFELMEIEKQVRWEHDHEFEFGGKMYDIVSMDTSDQTVRIWCWKDHDETGLNESLKQVARQSQQDHSQNCQQYLRLLHFYSHLYWSEQHDRGNLTNWNSWTFLPYISHWEMIYRSPPDPPPILC